MCYTWWLKTLYERSFGLNSVRKTQWVISVHMKLHLMAINVFWEILRSKISEIFLRVKEGWFIILCKVWALVDGCYVRSNKSVRVEFIHLKQRSED